MSVRFGSSLLVLALSAGVAAAAPATPDEAQRLQALFARYVGAGAATSGALVVAPQGESYAVTLDAGRLLGLLQRPDLTLTGGVLAATLTPQPDGRWRVVVDGLPGVGVSVGQQTTAIAIEGYKLDGIFDPMLQAFATASASRTGETTTSQGPSGSSQSHMTGATTASSTSSAAGPGLVDSTASQSSKTFAYTLDITPPPAAPPAPSVPTTHIGVTGSDAASSFKVDRLRNLAFNELWAFVVAHPSKAQLVASQAELKAKLKAALPLVSAVSADTTLGAMSVTTSLGDFGARAVTAHVEMGGEATKDGAATRFALSGLTLPAGLLPAWAAPLTPVSLDIGESYGPFDLAPSLTAAVDQMDLSQDPPLNDAQVQALQAGLLAGSPTLRITKSSIATALMKVSVDSTLTLVQPLPYGTATVSVTGLDRTLDAIRAASPDDPGATQAIALMSSVKILAKAEGPDSYSWLVEAKPGGTLMVNGQQLGRAPPTEPAPQQAPRKKKAPSATP